uniref:Uncharacterized protein n=1 Tax=Astyanax mexicanus TaxID=7994 RepID=A0A8B9JTA8_ASTMX
TSLTNATNPNSNVPKSRIKPSKLDSKNSYSNKIKILKKKKTMFRHYFFQVYVTSKPLNLPMMQTHSYFCPPISFTEALPKPHRTHSGTQATSVSSHFSSPLTTTSRLITPSKADLMTPALSRSMAQSSQETHRRVQMSEREKTGMSEETTQFERTSTSISTRSFSVTGAVPFTTAEKSLEASYVTTTSASVVSAPMVPLAVEEPGSIPSTHVEEDLQEMPIENQSNAGPHTSDTEEEAALISQLPAGHPSSLPPSPEREVPFDRHAGDTRASDEGEDEETEVSTEMAQISHAPMSAWEENDTTVPEEKDIVSELKSQAIRVNYVQQCSVEATLAYLQQLDENSENLVSPSFEEMSLHSMDAMNQDEKNYQSDILGLVDVTERVSNVSEEVFLKSEPEIKNESTESYEIMDNKTKEMEDMVQFDHYGTEAKEGHHSDMELQEAETVRQVKESKEEKEIDREEEEREKDIEKVDVHRSSAQEPAEQADELVMKINDKDSMVEEDHPEEDKSDEDEESLNISASWRTDPGDADTLADTRPLIHYKSDDEADAHTQASHFGVSEPIDSEDEREKHEGALMWGQTTAKRFDTMEDLSEEPEIITSDDVVMDKSAHTLESVGLVDDVLVDQAVNEFNICEESKQGFGLAMEDKTEEEINQFQNLLDESSFTHSQQLGLEAFLSETRDINEQPNTGEDETTISQTVVEENNDEIANEESEEPFDYFPLATDSTPQPEEASQEQALDEKPSEMSPKPSETSNSDAFPFETILTKEKVCVKEEEDEQSHISMVTHADFTDNISLYSGLNSRPDSQTNVDHSDLEESNSSEDESPNASQCSQLFSHSGISTEELDSSNAATVGEALKAHDSMSLTGFLEETLVKSFGQDCFAEGENLSQHHEEHEELPVENSSSGIDEDSNSVPKMQECETLDLDHQDKTTGASHDILSAEADLNDLRQDNESEKLDIFQDNVLNEEPQEPKEKENDSHSFFSSSIKEDIWNISKFEMAATYDSHGSTETERYSPDTLHPNQSMAFGEDWGQIGSLKPANGKPEKEISAGQSDEEEEVEEEREEQKMPKAKQPQCKDAKDGVAEAVQSDDSIEEGDSWSSGEE